MRMKRRDLLKSAGVGAASLVLGTLRTQAGTLPEEAQSGLCLRRPVAGRGHGLRRQQGRADAQSGPAGPREREFPERRVVLSRLQPVPGQPADRPIPADSRRIPERCAAAQRGDDPRGGVPAQRLPDRLHRQVAPGRQPAERVHSARASPGVRVLEGPELHPRVQQLVLLR